MRVTTEFLFSWRWSVCVCACTNAIKGLHREESKRKTPLKSEGGDVIAANLHILINRAV